MLVLAGLLMAMQSFWVANDRTGVPVTECILGERVLAIADEGLFPTTVVGEAGPGHCLAKLDERAYMPPFTAAFADLLRGTQPPAPSAEAMRFGAMESFTDADVTRFRSLALDNHADARVYFSRFNLNNYDDTIVARICNRDWESPVCRRANGQFHGSYNQAMEALDARNARMAEEDRLARAASEPVNSGYYQSGQYSRDVAASQGMATGVSSPATSAPVQVQSESEIRRQQERCRTGSGPC